MTVTPTVLAANKVYDGTTSATLTSCTLAGLVGGDAVGCTGTAAFDTAKAGTGKTVTVSGLTLTGAAAGNYALASTTATTTAAITALVGTPVPNAGDKTYDGTNSTTLTGCTVMGVIGGDVVSCTGTATFDSPMAGDGKTVRVSNISLVGPAAGNYTLNPAPGEVEAMIELVTTADIQPRTVTPTVTVTNKVYDGATAGTLATCALAGVVGRRRRQLHRHRHVRDVRRRHRKSGHDQRPVTRRPACRQLRSRLDDGHHDRHDSAADRDPGGHRRGQAIRRDDRRDDRHLHGHRNGWRRRGRVHRHGHFDSASVGNGKTVTVTNLALTGPAASNYALAATTITTTGAITQPNRAPVVTNPGTQSAYTGASRVLALAATDADGDALTWSAVNLPTGMAINPSSGVISGTPTATGVFAVVVSVFDGSATGQAAFTWTIVASLLPGAASPVSPAGSTPTTTPMFRWSAVPLATYYALQITDANAASSQALIWYTPAQAGCAIGTGTCSVAAPRTLQAGLVTWTVITWNPNGYGPWSAALKAVIDLSDATVPKPVPVGPSGSVASRTPQYSWNSVAGATWYQLSVTDVFGSPLEYWYLPSQVCVSTLCAASPAVPIAVGPANWRVRAWRATGAGPWTTAMNFDAAETAPGKVTTIAPANSVSTATPTFTWNAMAAASYYLLRITDRDNVSVDHWFLPSDAGCAAGVGVCSVTPASATKAGAAHWEVLAWNGSGFGPWSETRAVRRRHFRSSGADAGHTWTGGCDQRHWRDVSVERRRRGAVVPARDSQQWRCADVLVVHRRGGRLPGERRVQRHSTDYNAERDRGVAGAGVDDGRARRVERCRAAHRERRRAGGAGACVAKRRRGQQVAAIAVERVGKLLPLLRGGVRQHRPPSREVAVAVRGELRQRRRVHDGCWRRSDERRGLVACARLERGRLQSVVHHDVDGDSVRPWRRVAKRLSHVLFVLAAGCAGTGLVQCAVAAPLTQSAPETVLEGELEVLIEDANTGSRTLYFLVAGSQRVPLRFTIDPPALATGTRIRVRGHWDADGTLVVTSLEKRA